MSTPDPSNETNPATHSDIGSAPGASAPAYVATPALRRTRLYDRHVKLGAKIVPFAGWEMPLQYGPSVLEEHRTVREAVGIFDTSHMGTVVVDGTNAAAAVQRMVTINAGALQPSHGAYAVTLRDNGGIVDDLTVFRDTVGFQLVVNAGTADKDFAHFQAITAGVPDARVMNLSSEFSILAVQGPRAAELIAAIATGPIPERLFTANVVRIAGGDVHLCRSGYTGEDGFEIMIHEKMADVGAIWDLLLKKGAAFGVKPIGLAARDTLRLEARLCLYGSDIDETTNPIEAGLGWVIKGTGYNGEAAVEKARAAGPSRKLTGFKVIGRGIARHGYSIHLPGEGDSLGEKVGEITSGTVAPTVGGAVALGYVPTALSTPGTRLLADCRGKPAVLEVVKGPFYKRA